MVTQIQTRRVRRPGLPANPLGDSGLTQWAAAVKEQVEVSQGVRGNYRDAAATLGMLIDAGIITDAQAKTMVNRR